MSGPLAQYERVYTARSETYLSAVTEAHRYAVIGEAIINDLRSGKLGSQAESLQPPGTDARIEHTGRVATFGSEEMLEALEGFYDAYREFITTLYGVRGTTMPSGEWRASHEEVTSVEDLRKSVRATQRGCCDRSRRAQR